MAESVADGFPGPPDDEHVDEYLLECLHRLHNDNPTARKSNSFERYLEHCLPFNRTGFSACASSSWKASRLSRAMAMKCQVAVLKYTVRTGQHQTYRDYWDCMRQQLDIALTYTWEEMSANGIRAQTFIRSHHDFLVVFMDVVDLAAVVDAGNKYGSVPQQAKRVVESSHIGRSMFHDVWLRISRYMYQQSIEATLKDLAHLDSDDTEVEHFKGIMRRGAEQLVAGGVATLSTQASSMVSCLNTVVKVDVESLNDEWEFRLCSILKTIGVNIGQLPMLPYDAVLF